MNLGFIRQYLGEVSRDRRTTPEVIIHTANPLGANIIAMNCQRYGLPYKIEPYKPANRLETEV